MTTGKVHDETIAATADHFLDVNSGGIVPSIQPSTTFARNERYELINPAHGYARDGAPGFDQVEKVIAELEQGSECRLFASGMAAVAAVFYSLSSGSVAVLPDSMYWGVTQWIQRFAERHDLQLIFYQPGDSASLQAAVSLHPEVAVVWVETPSNPLLAVTDIAHAAQVAHAHHARLVVDSTAATPVCSKPLALGADIVMHSATKALNGHSDVLAGVLISSESSPLWESICQERQQAGAVCGVFEAWLLLRGLRTLYVRMEKAMHNSMLVARYLDQHPGIASVHYPGLDHHPAHALAKRQMPGGFGALLSFEVNGGREAALQVAGELKLIPSATSLGGVETLIEHRYSIEPPETGVPESLLRLSVGIENGEDLISDLDQALKVL